MVSLSWTFSRARLVLVPVWAGGHCTLLVLQQSQPQAADTAAAGQEAENACSPQKGGCSKCLGTGCLKCCPAKGQQYSHRKEQARKLFDPACWPELTGGSWSVRYDDPLPTESTASREAASRILQHFAALGWPQNLPPTEPGLRQRDSVSCGLFVLHWTEAALREFRGEGPSVSAFEPKKRLQTLMYWLLALSNKAELTAEHTAKDLSKGSKGSKSSQASKASKASKPGRHQEGSSRIKRGRGPPWMEGPCCDQCVHHDHERTLHM